VCSLVKAYDGYGFGNIINMKSSGLNCTNFQFITFFYVFSYTLDLAL